MIQRCLFIVVIGCVNCCFGQVPTNGLIGYWPFSGNASDISGTGNHGTIFGASLTTDRCGNANSAYLFNGTSDYIKMQAAGPGGASPRTIGFWAKTSYTSTAVKSALGY